MGRTMGNRQSWQRLEHSARVCVAEPSLTSLATATPADEQVGHPAVQAGYPPTTNAPLRICFPEKQVWTLPSKHRSASHKAPLVSPLVS